MQQVTIFVYKDHLETQRISSHTDTLFPHCLIPSPSLSFLVESSNSREFTPLKFPASASSQTRPVMMWPLLPGVSQSSLISHTSKPHPCELFWSDKPALLWGGLIRVDVLIKPEHSMGLAGCRHPQKPQLVSHLQLLIPPFFNQETVQCSELQTGPHSRWISCGSLNPI